MDTLNNLRNLDLRDVLSPLRITDPPESWKRHWTQARETFAPAALEFLKPENLVAANRLLNLQDEAFQTMLSAAAVIRENEALAAFTWYWHFLIFHVDGFFEFPYEWPLPCSVMGDLAAMIPALVGVSGLPHMFEHHRRLGIPEEISRGALADFDTWIRDYHSKNGIWGLHELAWLMQQLQGKLYQLGRLQFKLEPNGLPVRVFRNVKDGSVLAFSEPGIAYRSDGMVDGLNGVYDPDGAWVSQLEMTDTVIRGNAILRDGNSHPEITEVPAEDWQLVLSPGDQIVEVHIPAHGKMLHEECLRSYARAVDFFEKYFPERQWSCFTCTTWLLDTQLRRLLPADSNIVLFQQEYHIVPIASGENQTFERVFACKPTRDTSTLPRDTFLRRAIADFIDQGNRMRGQGGFILKEDVRR